MKKDYILRGSLSVVVLSCITIGVLNLNLLVGNGWATIVFIIALVLGFSIIFFIYQYALTYRRRHSLDQVKFLKSLKEESSSYSRMFLEAWPIIVKHNSVPEEMDDKEWTKVVDALSKCYKSVAFLFEVAQLVKKRIIDEDLLYIFCYDQITGYWKQKLGFLVKWCGTGLDLAADYDSYELARIVTTTRELVAKMNAVHEKHGADLEAEGYAAELERFEERVRDFLADPSKLSVSSDNYIGNYVTVKE